MSWPEIALKKDGWYAATVTFDKKSDRISASFGVKLHVLVCNDKLKIDKPRWLKGYGPRIAQLKFRLIKACLSDSIHIRSTCATHVSVQRTHTQHRHAAHTRTQAQHMHNTLFSSKSLSQHTRTHTDRQTHTHTTAHRSLVAGIE